MLLIGIDTDETMAMVDIGTDAFLSFVSEKLASKAISLLKLGKFSGGIWSWLITESISVSAGNIYEYLKQNDELGTAVLVLKKSNGWSADGKPHIIKSSNGAIEFTYEIRLALPPSTSITPQSDKLTEEKPATFSDIQNHQNAGDKYYEQEKYNQAIAEYSQVIAIEPNYAHAYHGRGKAYYKKEDFSKAIYNYGQAILLKYDYAMAYNNRGNAYYQTGETELAIADYEQVLFLDNDAIAKQEAKQALNTLNGEN